jgi:hypothetical protein
MPKPSSKASKRSERLEPPFRYFGGKRLIAPTVWELLGNPQSCIEPFAGGLAVLLARPMPIAANVMETVNDIDGTIVNIWRSIRQDPETLAVWLDRPPAEADLIAAHNYLVENKERIEQLVKSHPDACDPLAAAYHLHFLAGGWRIINWKAAGGYTLLAKHKVNLNPLSEILYISPNCRPHPQAVLLADLLG